MPRGQRKRSRHAIRKQEELDKLARVKEAQRRHNEQEEQKELRRKEDVRKLPSYITEVSVFGKGDTPLHLPKLPKPIHHPAPQGAALKDRRFW